MTRRSVVISAGFIVLIAGACVRPTPFDRYLADDKWSEAAREFESDSALRSSENGLYGGGVVFGTPGRPTYDPAKARELFIALLSRYPETDHRADATARMLLLEDVLRARRDAAQLERELEARIANLTRETRDLRARADSIAAPNDSLRAVVTRLEAERREREEQLRALRLELQRLKEIDLKPRPPVKPIKP